MTSTRIARPQTAPRVVDMSIGPGHPGFPGIERAACRTEDPELFFPCMQNGEQSKRQEAQILAAKAVCGRCPVRMTCLGASLARDEQLGIWGGLTPAERRRTLRDIHALRRDCRRIIRRIESGERVYLTMADALPVVYRLRKDAAWTIDDLARALGVLPPTVYVLYRRGLVAAKVAEAMEAISAPGRFAA